MRDTKLPRENIYGHTKKLRFILDRLDRYIHERGAPITVLDFGCGNGSAISQFVAQRPVIYYGVDLHRPSLKYAQQHFGDERTRFVDRIPQDVEFDIIIYSDVIEHLDQPQAVLASHWPVLKRHGIIIGSVPNGYGPFENEKRLVRWLRIDRAVAVLVWLKRRLVGRRSRALSIPYNDESGHVQFFTRLSLITMLDRAGYRVERFTNGAFVGAPISEVLLLRGELIARANAWVAGNLPWWAVSTWYFTATKQSPVEEE